MTAKIKKLKSIFKKIDLKGTKVKILDELIKFERQTTEYKSDPKCDIVILWMKNIILQNLNYFARAEELLDEALTKIIKINDKAFQKWKLKIYLSLAYIHQAQCNYIDADYYLKEAQLITDADPSLSKFLGEICSLLADVNLHLNEYTQARKYVDLEVTASFQKYQDQKKDKASSIIYAYSLINFCRVKREIGLVDNTLAQTISKALGITETIQYEKGLLKAKLEQAQRNFVMNFAEIALEQVN